jgi:hypothetical protein
MFHQQKLTYFHWVLPRNESQLRTETATEYRLIRPIPLSIEGINKFGALGQIIVICQNWSIRRIPLPSFTAVSSNAHWLPWGPLFLMLREWQLHGLDWRVTWWQTWGSGTSQGRWQTSNGALANLFTREIFVFKGTDAPLPRLPKMK